MEEQQALDKRLARERMIQRHKTMLARYVKEVKEVKRLQDWYKENAWKFTVTEAGKHLASIDDHIFRAYVVKQRMMRHPSHFSNFRLDWDADGSPKVDEDTV